MAVKSFRKLNTDDRNLNLVQDNIDNAFNPLTKNELLDGLIITDIDLVTGQDNIINHKLGRKIQGWIVIGKDAAADIYDNQSSNSLPNLTLLLRTTANCTINLYVF